MLRLNLPEKICHCGINSNRYYKNITNMFSIIVIKRIYIFGMLTMTENIFCGQVLNRLNFLH